MGSRSWWTGAPLPHPELFPCRCACPPAPHGLHDDLVNVRESADTPATPPMAAPALTRLVPKHPPVTLSPLPPFTPFHMPAGQTWRVSAQGRRAGGERPFRGVCSPSQPGSPQSPPLPDPQSTLALSQDAFFSGDLQHALGPARQREGHGGGGGYAQGEVPHPLTTPPAPWQALKLLVMIHISWCSTGCSRAPKSAS